MQALDLHHPQLRGCGRARHASEMFAGRKSALGWRSRVETDWTGGRATCWHLPVGVNLLAIARGRLAWRKKEPPPIKCFWHRRGTMAAQLNSSVTGREQGSGIEGPHRTSDSGVAPKSPWRRFSDKWLRMDKLVWWTMLGVVCGIALGGGLYTVGPSDRAVKLIGYPGELLLHALQELILPLMTFAVTSGVFSLRPAQTGGGKIAKWSIFHYFISMVLAIGVGAMMVFSVQPGRSRPFDNSGRVGE